MMACINPACVGGPQRCEPGYTGIMCTDCEPAFKDGKIRKLGKKPGHTCEVCLEPAVNATRFAAVGGRADRRHVGDLLFYSLHHQERRGGKVGPVDDWKDRILLHSVQQFGDAL